MVNFNQYLHPTLLDYKKVIPGSTVNAYFYPGSIRPAIDALLAKHTVTINDDTNNANTVLRRYTHKGGRDVETIEVAENDNITAGTTTITIDGRVYTFVASGAVGNQINKGADEAGTATNIKNKIANRKGYEASVSTATVTVKGRDDGELIISTNAPTAFTLANSTAIKPFTKETYDGDLVNEGTGNIWELEVHVADANNDLRPDTVRVIAYTPTITNPATALATLVARIKAVRAHALAGSEPVGFDSNQEPITIGSVTSKLNATPANIALALQRVYGSVADTAFVISGTKSNILTCTVQGSDYASYIGNKLRIGVGVESSLPQLEILLSEDGTPYIKGRGIGDSAGSIDGYKHAKTGNAVTVNHSNNKQEFGTTKTRTVEQVTWKANELYDADLQKVGSGDSNIARSGLYEYVMTGGDSFLCGLIVSIVDNLGNQHYEVFYEGLLTAGIETEFTVESTTGMNFSYKPIPKAGVADSTGFTAIRVKKALPAYS